MFRIAVLGSNGQMGRKHCEAYDGLGHKIVGAEDSPDIVSIATPDQSHARQVIAALKAGRHVFCEKPVSHVPFDLWRIKRLAGKGRSKLGVNLPLRYTPKFADIIVRVSLGELGTIYAIEAAYNWGRRWKLKEGWRAACRPYSYMAAGGIHMMDVADAMLDGNQKWMELAGVSDARVDIRHWQAGTAKVTIRANFGYNGRHEHWLRVWGEGRMIEVINETEPANHFKPIGEFCRAVEYNIPTNGLRALYLNRLAL